MGFVVLHQIIREEGVLCQQDQGKIRRFFHVNRGLGSKGVLSGYIKLDTEQQQIRIMKGCGKKAVTGYDGCIQSAVCYHGFVG